MTTTKSSSSLSFLKGYVYIDSNGNGKKDHGEWVIDGAIVRLYLDAGGLLTSVGTCQTGVDGSYSFGKLAPGIYTLVMPPLCDCIQGQSTPGTFVDANGNPVALNSVRLGVKTSLKTSVQPSGSDEITNIDLQSGNRRHQLQLRRVGSAARSSLQAAVPGLDADRHLLH